MSSRSIGVMNVVLRCWITSCVTVSPSCSRSWMRRAFTSTSVKSDTRSSRSSAAIRMFSAPEENNPKNTSDRLEIFSFIGNLLAASGARGERQVHPAELRRRGPVQQQHRDRDDQEEPRAPAEIPHRTALNGK